MSPPDPTKKLLALIKRLRADYPEPCDPGVQSCPEGHDPLVWQLVFSFMSWEAGTAKAAPATRKLHAGVIDYNEMRVCLPDELIALIGERYPRAPERVQRLRSTLNDLYRREHTVTLSNLPAMPKREARAYLDSLDGLPPYVAARLMLLSFGGHAFPVDERMYLSLLEEQAAPEGTFEEVAGWLERAFHAGEAGEPYRILEAWLNDRPPPAPVKPARKPAAVKPGPAKAKPTPEPTAPKAVRPEKPKAPPTSSPKKSAKP